MTEPTAEASTVITAEDLDGLNRRALLRVVDRTRRVSTVLLALAGLLALAWLWLMLRGQGFIGEGGDEISFTFVGENLSVRQRLDFFSGTLTPLAHATLVTGLGVALRLYCEAATLRAGGNLTGWELGDRVDQPADDEAT